MERLNRGVQLKQRQHESTSTTKGNLANNMKGMFFPSQPHKKPKGSRNIPLSLAEDTAIPASCWPLLEAHEAGLNMWTQSGCHSGQYSSTDGTSRTIKSAARKPKHSELSSRGFRQESDT